MESNQAEPNALTKSDIWMAGHVFRKRRKLQSLVAASEDRNIRLAATKALRLELVFYALWITGMIALGLGALVIGST